MASTTTAQTNGAPSLAQRTAIGILSALPTTNPTLKAIQKALPSFPSLPPSVLPNLPNLGNGLSSAMAATLPAGPGVQNSTTNQNNMCENCHAHPRWLDPSTGVLHNFCSRACAKANATAVNCEHCKVRPKYHDGKSTHPYCSRTCASASKTNGNHNGNGNTNGNQPNGNRPTPRRGNTMPGAFTTTPPVSACSIPGCQQAAYKDSNGNPGKYCGKTHQALGRKGCIACRKADKSGKTNFCTACEVSVMQSAPAVVEIAEENETFKSVAQQFKRSWRHTTACPKVRAIYKIVSSQQILDKYSAYRDSVEARGNFTAVNRPPGNENRRWHGTRRKCALGDKGCTTFCSDLQCSLCCIIRTSFDLAHFGKKTSWGRFGPGIYTSSTSSKANDYSSTDSTSPLKAILLNKVVVGKGYKIHHDNPSMTAPPSGYDSVLAEVGGSLNYDELIVYTNDAVRPSYLVMYE